MGGQRGAQYPGQRGGETLAGLTHHTACRGRCVAREVALSHLPTLRCWSRRDDSACTRVRDNYRGTLYSSSPLVIIFPKVADSNHSNFLNSLLTATPTTLCIPYFFSSAAPRCNSREVWESVVFALRASGHLGLWSSANGYRSLGRGTHPTSTGFHADENTAAVG